MLKRQSAFQVLPTHSLARQTAIGILVALFAFVFRIVLIQIIPPERPFLVFFAAVVISAWLGGAVAGLVTTLLTALLANYFFIEPHFSFALGFYDFLQTFLFCVEGALISAFSYQMHRAYGRALKEIEEHKQTEEYLRESEERFRLLVEGVKDYAIFMLDPQGRVALWNAGAERIKGYTAEEIIGRELASLYPPEEQEKGTPQRLMETAIREGSAQIEGWRMRKDGARFWAHVTLTSIWQNGQLRGFAKVTRDMTDQRRAEQLAESLRMERIARAEAERANVLKTNFLAMISHELRTPLTSVKGFTTTLLSDEVSFTQQQQRDFLQIIDQEADKLHELIEQLLNLSQIQAGVFQIRTMPQPLSACLEFARDQLKSLTADRDFQITLPDDLPNVLIDERRTAQVIVNIVENAVKHTQPGSPITLSADLANEKVQVEIHDEGPGIPQNRRESIFEAFSQLEQKPNAIEGLGLGLAICKGLVEAQGGRIWVKDDSRPGTTIVFTLPTVKEAELLKDSSSA